MAKTGLQLATDGGLLPLHVMLARLRHETLPNGRAPTDKQVAVAIAAAPYIHPRLSAVAFQEQRPPSRIDTSKLTNEQRKQLLLIMRSGLLQPDGAVKTIEGQVVGKVEEDDLDRK